MLKPILNRNFVLSCSHCFYTRRCAKVNMSIPKNHHYVSQVHLKNFFNVDEGQIYIYDKTRKNFYSKKSTKTVFSEKYSNSRYLNGKLDHKSLEDDLNEHFEKDFSSHYDTINSFIQNRTWNTEVQNALIYIAKYGIIADFRTPRYKQNFEENFFRLLSIFPRALYLN